MENSLIRNMLDYKELKKMRFKHLGENVQISSKASIYGSTFISIADNVRIDDFTVISASDKVEIGCNVHIGNQSTIITGDAFVIGDFSTLSVGTRVFTKSDDFSGETMTNPTVPDLYKNVTYAKVILGKHVVIGSNSVILPGSVIEDGCAVGAMSLVKGRLEAWKIYSGIPAKYLKDRKKDLLHLKDNFNSSMK